MDPGNDEEVKTMGKRGVEKRGEAAWRERKAWLRKVVCVWVFQALGILSCPLSRCPYIFQGRQNEPCLGRFLGCYLWLCLWNSSFLFDIWDFSKKIFVWRNKILKHKNQIVRVGLQLKQNHRKPYENHRPRVREGRPLNTWQGTLRPRRKSWQRGHGVIKSEVCWKALCSTE